MSHNHGRRIIDVMTDEDLREKTRGDLYDIIADLIRRAPKAAAAMGYRLLTRKEAKHRAAERSDCDQPEARP